MENNRRDIIFGFGAVCLRAAVCNRKPEIRPGGGFADLLFYRVPGVRPVHGAEKIRTGVNGKVRPEI